MSLYMPGAVQRPQPGGVTLDTSLPPRYVWHITWDKLNADGTQPHFSDVAQYLIDQQFCPNIMWNPFTGYMEQYYPANLGGRALKYNNQDGSPCVQVEVFFTPGCVVDGVKYATVADTPLIGWEDLLAWGDSLGVPRTWPMGAPQWQNNPRDVGIWNASAGHYGHCHSPGDTHTDPGPMPALTGTISTQSATIQEYEVITDEDVARIAQAAADKLMPSITIQNDQYHGATRGNVIDALSKKIDGSAYEGKVFLQTTVNPRFDQAVNAAANIPASVLNQKFALPEGTVTNLAGILTAIHAQPATITGGVLDVDGLVARLKTELPPAVLAELTDKLTK